MTSSIAHRIKGLERTRMTASCPVCGAPDSHRQFTVHMNGIDPPCDTTEHCPGCGRRQVFTIDFDQRG